jgi:hypothetical protein
MGHKDCMIECGGKAVTIWQVSNTNLRVSNELLYLLAAAIVTGINLYGTVPGLLSCYMG